MHLFILPTKDLLSRRGVIPSNVSSRDLCTQANESVQHMIWNCCYADVFVSLIAMLTRLKGYLLSCAAMVAIQGHVTHQFLRLDMVTLKPVILKKREGCLEGSFELHIMDFAAYKKPNFFKGDFASAISALVLIKQTSTKYCLASSLIIVYRGSQMVVKKSYKTCNLFRNAVDQRTL